MGRAPQVSGVPPSPPPYLAALRRRFYTRAGRREHVETNADLEAVSTEIAERVRILDGLVRYRFGDNPALMEGWASTRDVLGPVRTKAQQQPEAGGSETPKAA